MGKLVQLEVCEFWGTTFRLCSNTKVQGTYEAVTSLDPVVIRYTNSPQELTCSILLIVNPGLAPYILDLFLIHHGMNQWYYGSASVLLFLLELGLVCNRHFSESLRNKFQHLFVMCLYNSGNLQNAICLMLFLFYPSINAIDPSDSMAVKLPLSVTLFQNVSM